MRYHIIIATSILLISSSTADENLCPCKFDDNDDLQNCRVYGQLGDDVLIPWYLASQDCLDAHNIKISAIPSYTLESMCNPPNANTFVNYLKFESTAAATSIKQSYPEFWDGDSNPIILVDTINGIDCKANSNDCYNEIKTYFSSNPSEIDKNCQTFYNAAKKDLELEQSTVRISICNNEIEADDECGELQIQVEEVKAVNPDKACSAYGLGPVGGNEQPPSCSSEEGEEEEEEEVEEDADATSDSTSTSASTISRGSMEVMGLLLVFMLHTSGLLIL